MDCGGGGGGESGGVKLELAVLRNDIESFETWGVSNSFSPVDEAILFGGSTLAELGGRGRRPNFIFHFFPITISHSPI